MYNRIIVCAHNEINSVCDEFSFTIYYNNPIDLLFVILTPIGSLIVLYYLYRKIYVINFFLRMENVSFSDEKVYSNSKFHK